MTLKPAGSANSHIAWAGFPLYFQAKESASSRLKLLRSGRGLRRALVSTTVTAVPTGAQSQ
ncbi:hypothetical protein [Paludibaculum fermentans]|uniref:Uncharacterized protein n=1 Tax=Paludibaculum fermentans TaxID=1473598 RepID=A0A7S7SL36_PALFE|nr:hypothetical protein [Paludibaculum fermentans]QOY89827.1 hypothetical protein IRI77_07705 [Paludibaculum fermentans]